MERNPAYLVLSSLYDLSIFYAMLRYADQNVSQRMIQSLKYKDDPQVGFLLGQLLGRRCKNKIAKDAVLLAIPLHSTKEKIRGYNQSEEIVKGMQYECLSWQITTTVRRKVNTVTQTKKSRAERWENVADIFEIQDMSELQAKHVVIVDDVITTGSTILSMIKCIMLANPKSIGVVTAASPSKI
ncbi:MAG: hypothetical protein LAT68_01600 [Cyclobacteriaceae bacterium]|nr:ComF family protein [Cyclobacteriaceae bacterium]MCH8514997.1 hypothetical protein [Cyclobacteriaceae bacterium]